MADVQQIEAAVGDHQPLAGGPYLRPPLGQVFPSNDFLTKIHCHILINVFPAWKQEVEKRGAHHVKYHRSEEGRPLTPPSPIRWERGKTRWQQGRSRPLTHAPSPSDGEREERDAATFARPAGNHDSELEVFELAQAQLNGKPADEQRQRREA